jgi:hybrid cluster-associated redox disulfide protein
LNNFLSKKELISDVVARSPKIAGLLSQYGLACLNCPLNRFETIEEGAQLHGMTEPEIEKMISEINSQL